MNLYNIVSFHRFDSYSSDEDVLLVAVQCVGKSNGDQTDDDNKEDDEDDEEVQSTGKNLMRILGMQVFH